MSQYYTATLTIPKEVRRMIATNEPTHPMHAFYPGNSAHDKLARRSPWNMLRRNKRSRTVDLVADPEGTYFIDLAGDS